MNAIEVKHLSKNFAKLHALDDVNFVVREGSITGFLGPNGAGKSTTINLLLGFINATAGEMQIFGDPIDVGTVKTRVSVGFLSNSMALDKTLTVEQEFKYFGHLAGHYDDKTAKEFAKRLDLDLHAKIGGLSTGNYQKVGLVIALMNRPKLLILDEPTNGLDPLVQNEFNKIILNMRDHGTTIFISSHILSEVKELCDEFIFIRNGKIVAQMDQKQLSEHSGESLRVNLTKSNRDKILKLLDENHADYSLETGDLEKTFMQFYEDDPRDTKEAK